MYKTRSWTRNTMPRGQRFESCARLESGHHHPWPPLRKGGNSSRGELARCGQNPLLNQGGFSRKKVTLGNILHHRSRTSQEDESPTRFCTCAGYFPRKVGSEQWCYQDDRLSEAKRAFEKHAIGVGSIARHRSKRARSEPPHRDRDALIGLTAKWACTISGHDALGEPGVYAARQEPRTGVMKS
jgi:hypothetical protein